MMINAGPLGLSQPDHEFQARLAEFAEKANEGALSSQESMEYQKYIEYMDFVALMRLKARSRVIVDYSNT